MQDESVRAASADHNYMYIEHGRQTKIDIECTSMGLAHVRIVMYMIKVINRDRVGHGIVSEITCKYPVTPLPLLCQH